MSLAAVRLPTNTRERCSGYTGHTLQHGQHSRAVAIPDAQLRQRDFPMRVAKHAILARVQQQVVEEVKCERLEASPAHLHPINNTVGQVAPSVMQVRWVGHAHQLHTLLRTPSRMYSRDGLMSLTPVICWMCAIFSLFSRPWMARLMCIADACTALKATCMTTHM